jgi:hypothetical protein
MSEQQPVSLSVIKAEREEADRKFSKQELVDWVAALPEDITGFAVCATRHQDNGGVWTKSTAIGNSVMARYEALHIAVFEFLQFKGPAS